MSKVAIVKGENRENNIKQVLEILEEDIEKSIKVAINYFEKNKDDYKVVLP